MIRANGKSIREKYAYMSSFKDKQDDLERRSSRSKPKLVSNMSKQTERKFEY